MFLPAVGPNMGDILAQVAVLNRKVLELQKELVYINGQMWDVLKRIDEATSLPRPPGPNPRKRS